MYGTCIPNNVIKTSKFLKLKKKIFVSGSRKRFHFHLSEVKLSIFVTFYKQLKGAKLKNEKKKNTSKSCAERHELDKCQNRIDFEIINDK